LPAICWNKRGGSCYCTLEMPFIVLWNKAWASHHEKCTGTHWGPGNDQSFLTQSTGCPALWE
jgi:hypothetical protein